MQSAVSLRSLLGVITAEARRAIGARHAVSSLPHEGDWAAGLHDSSFSDSYADWRGKAAPPDGTGLDALVMAPADAVRLTPAEVEAHPAHRPQEGRPPLRGYLAAPLLGRSGRSLGLVQLSDRREGDFTEDDENVLVQLASLAAAAIENVRLYDALREADKRKDEFLATLAHELRNPLAPVRTGLQVLRLAGPATGPAAQARQMMERQVAHMVRLIDDLLDLSRINKGRINIQKERVRLADIVARAAEAAQPALDERRQKLEAIADESLRLEADPVRLAQVLGNLLANASRYAPEGGTIRLEVRREGGQAVLRVSDDGVGIAPDMLERIFDMFAQERNNEMRSQGGLGIGLTLVRGLVELHGGKVSASSAGRGKGSTFTVRLPVEAESAQSAPQEDVNRKESRAGHRVLVVDDNHDSAESLAVLLRLLGQEVELAHDGPSALEAAAAFEPELVLLDIGLPGLSGLEVARRLRQTPVGKQARLIAMTGYGQEEDRRRSMEAGFDRHLVKPIDPELVEGLLAGLPMPG